MGYEANLSTVLQILGSEQHFAEDELDHVQLLDSRTTNVKNTHISHVSACSVTKDIINTHTGQWLSNTKEYERDCTIWN